jgi:Mn2+/Fe2+ NRAMP family transporter
MFIAVSQAFIARPLVRAPEQAEAADERIRLDTYVGMAFSNLIALFIVITTAATLNAHGVTDIQTSSQAAEALRPIAGRFAFAVFAAGIIGTGLLALPVLAGSAAYGMGEAFGWHVGLARKPGRARAFYATIAIARAVGAALNLTALGAGAIAPDQPLSPYLLPPYHERGAGHERRVRPRCHSSARSL